VTILEGDMGEIRNEIVPRRILDHIPLKRVNEDLERYQAKAIEMGAEAAKIIFSNEIVMDERVRANGERVKREDLPNVLLVGLVLIY
jgi:hypothetical protein